ncbi:hypothetical protein OG223_03370 [Streptomyces sp. NBC_01478]|uniref:hypothetical protein n=1 Tax=Streptomyces sp. NBC_01478 TaxID=2903882 RepID=UPI002E32D1AD|nr:hypothetical protein [Streptomyces sp. NBC_01478]
MLVTAVGGPAGVGRTEPALQSARAALPLPTPAFAGHDDELAALSAFFARDTRQGSPVAVIGGGRRRQDGTGPDGCPPGPRPGPVPRQGAFADVVRLHGSALLGGFLRAMGLNSPATAARCSSSSTT